MLLLNQYLNKHLYYLVIIKTLKKLNNLSLKILISLVTFNFNSKWHIYVQLFPFRITLSMYFNELSTLKILILHSIQVEFLQ